MSQHLNRLNDKEAIEFDKVFDEFCKRENKMNTRITLGMTIGEVLVAMGGGSPGALTVCMDILNKGAEIDPQHLMGGFGALLNMDTLGVYEHRIWGVL